MSHAPVALIAAVFAPSTGRATVGHLESSRALVAEARR